MGSVNRVGFVVSQAAVVILLVCLVASRVEVSAVRTSDDEHRKLVEGLQKAVAAQDSQIGSLSVSNRIFEMDYRELSATHRRTAQVLEQQKKLLSLAMKAIRNANVDDKELVDQALRAIKEYGVGDSDLIGKPVYGEGEIAPSRSVK